MKKQQIEDIKWGGWIIVIGILFLLMIMNCNRPLADMIEKQHPKYEEPEEREIPSGSYHGGKIKSNEDKADE
jgi:hypothetical protein